MRTLVILACAALAACEGYEPMPWPTAAYSPIYFPPATMPSYSTPTTGWGSPPQIIYTPRGSIMCQSISATSVMCN